MPGLKISGVALQFACQISGIAIQSPHLHFATQNYTQTNKKCEELLHKLIGLCEKFQKSL
jgi:hypothetical protein